MSGIPKEKIADFWVSFWGGLFSGLISAFIGGLIVGIFLWLLQISREKKEASRTCEREISTVHQKVKILLNDILPISLTLYLKEWLPKNILDSFELVLEVPVTYWTENIKNKKTLRLIEILKQSQKEIYDFRLSSNKLDQHLKDELVKQYSVYELMFQHGVYYCYGMINEDYFEHLRKWANFPASQQDDVYYSFFKQILEQDRTKQYIVQYLDDKNTLLSTLTKIKLMD